METLTARLQGGLGNQMFIAAAAALLARRLDRALVFDVSAFEKDPQRGFALGDFDAFVHVPKTVQAFSRRRRVLDASRRLAGIPDRQLFRQVGFEYDPRFETLDSCDRVSGYFQSRKYLTAEPAFVRSLFTVSSKSDLQEFVHTQVGQRYIGVHVRRGDYLRAGNQAVHGVCDADYYTNALVLLRRLVGADLPIVAFTESSAELPASVRELADLVIADGQNRSPVEDLLALAGASSLALSNSSFSWWAAYLQRSSEPVMVVAPRPWMRRGDIAASDLLDPSWITLGARN